MDNVPMPESSTPFPAVSPSLVPASVVVGFLGAGKTTLINHLLTSVHDQKLAVIVNDFSEINIDARLVRHTSDRLIEMSNGCICCTLREDLVEELEELSTIGGLDGIVIESTGIGEPLPIAQAFYMGSLPDRLRLQEIITVVDAAAFWNDYERSDWIEDAEGNAVNAPLAPLLIDQLEFTNVIVLNKTDMVSDGDLLRLEGYVRSLNPSARLLRATHANVDVSLLFKTGLYLYEDGEAAEDWDLTWEIDAAGEADEYGFNTFTYTSTAPFRYAQFMQLFEDWPDEIMRAKGFVSFVDHPQVIISVVRDTLDLQILGDIADTGEEPALATSEIDESVEIVFIGRAMPVQAILERLEACHPS
ncbi:MAG: GTP-binding protein [Thermomicrobiales bacterium]